MEATTGKYGYRRRAVVPGYTYIYALTEPSDGRVRYVGKADNPFIRYSCHLNEDSDGTRRANWIKGLKKKDRRPGLLIIERVAVDGWVERERYWIQYYRSMFSDLTNHSDGGDGATGVSVLWDEERKRRHAENRSSSWLLIGPEGQEYRITNLHRFAKANGLSSSGLVNVSRGRIRHSRGWKCLRLDDNGEAIQYPYVPKRLRTDAELTVIYRNAVKQAQAAVIKDWIVTAPDGTETAIRNLTAFCKANGLRMPAMHQVATGTRLSHRGWKCRRLENG